MSDAVHRLPDGALEKFRSAMMRHRDGGIALYEAEYPFSEDLPTLDGMIDGAISDLETAIIYSGGDKILSPDFFFVILQALDTLYYFRAMCGRNVEAREF